MKRWRRHMYSCLLIEFISTYTKLYSPQNSKSLYSTDDIVNGPEGLQRSEQTLEHVRRYMKRHKEDSRDMHPNYTIHVFINIGINFRKNQRKCIDPRQTSIVNWFNRSEYQSKYRNNVSTSGNMIAWESNRWFTSISGNPPIHTHTMQTTISGLRYIQMTLLYIKQKYTHVPSPNTYPPMHTQPPHTHIRSQSSVGRSLDTFR